MEVGSKLSGTDVFTKKKKKDYSDKLIDKMRLSLGKFRYSLFVKKKANLAMNCVVRLAEKKNPDKNISCDAKRFQRE